MGRGTLRILHGMAVLACFMAIGETADAKKAQPAKPNQVTGQLSEKYDTKLPVEISSDKLEVLQNENKAIFKGNVVAVQGKIRLSSETMIVHYKQKDDKEGQATKVKASSSQDSGSMGAITLIEVQGNVLVATPEESAKGDNGNYEVPRKCCTLPART